ncbi:hypothetical protein [Penaeicola halotolerans]|uniref:hypothetical protein n=1 Tax=Penaeicola halotolerans TaxID=2793196 RepID=UPI001CF84BE6|nr:hypothetical protein [Penaeicola halotolerans]
MVKFKVLFSVYFMLLASVFAQAQSKITVRSEVDKKPIPFALLVEKEGKKGLVADESGVLNMPQVALEAGNTIIISATGYQELEIKSEALAQLKEVFLQPKTFELDEFTITSSNLEPVMLGDTLWPIYRSEKGIQSGDKDEDARFGGYLNLKDNKDRLFSNVWIYFHNVDLEDPTKFRIRWLVSNEVRRPKPAKIYKNDQFFDVQNVTTVYQVKNEGWNSFDLSKDEIVIPKNYKGVFMIIDKLPDVYGEIDSTIIPFQDRGKKQIEPAIFSSWGLTALDDPYSQALGIAIEYLR